MTCVCTTDVQCAAHAYPNTPRLHDHRPGGECNEWCRDLPDPATVVETKYPEAVMVTSPTGGVTGQKLARFDLIPPRALWLVAEVYGIGADKYEDWNWRKGMDWSLPLAKLERHLNLFKQGEDYDPENGQAHLASVVFHALTLLTYMEEQTDYDDRWKP